MKEHQDKAAASVVSLVQVRPQGRAPLGEQGSGCALEWETVSEDRLSFPGTVKAVPTVWPLRGALAPKPNVPGEAEQAGWAATSLLEEGGLGQGSS